jgi:hypothetical protein
MLTGRNWNSAHCVWYLLPIPRYVLCSLTTSSHSAASSSQPTYKARKGTRLINRYRPFLRWTIISPRKCKLLSLPLVCDATVRLTVRSSSYPVCRSSSVPQRRSTFFPDGRNGEELCAFLAECECQHNSPRAVLYRRYLASGASLQAI